MPEGSYFKGHGDSVMASMRKRYGSKKGKEVFYATANKRSMGPAGDHMAKMKMAGKFKKKKA